MPPEGRCGCGMLGWHINSNYNLKFQVVSTTSLIRCHWAGIYIQFTIRGNTYSELCATSQSAWVGPLTELVRGPTHAPPDLPACCHADLSAAVEKLVTECCGVLCFIFRPQCRGLRSPIDRAHGRRLALCRILELCLTSPGLSEPVSPGSL